MTLPLAVLVGPLGSGRTLVGQALAQALEAELSETEALVEQHLGQPFAQAVIAGEPDTIARATTAAALEQLSPEGTRRIVTLLPSAASETVTAALENLPVPVVFLTAPIAELARRVGLDAPRAVSLGQPRGVFATMVKQLEQTYARLTPTVISTERRDPQAVAIEIVERFALQ